MRDQVFVSYAHEDKGWLEAFTTMLAPAVHRGLAQVWSDRDIPKGANWADNIRRALARAKVGVLLVTANFLKSEFIANEELVSLIRDACREELRLYWVPVSASLFDVTELAGLQAAWDPNHPLDQLSAPEQQRAIAEVCRNLLKELPKLSRESRDQFRETVAAKLRDRYELLEEVAVGASSIVYRAKPRGIDAERAVKALVHSATQRDLERCFRRTAELAAKLESPAYQRIYDYVLDEPPYCIVSEFVNGVRLDEHMAAVGLVPPRQARTILLDLARALAVAHQHNCLHEALTPSSVQIDAEHRPKLSAFRFTPVVAQAETAGLSLYRRDAITYMSPESFQGAPHTAFTDQYALGLIGYELLSGLCLPPIRCAADFLERPAFYATLSEGGAWTERSPALGGIVSRMLRVVPEHRWKSLREVVEVLENVNVHDSQFEELRSTVMKSYFQLQRKPDAFYAAFYERLFQRLPDVSAHFRPDRMQQQYAMLNRALTLLIELDAHKPLDAEELNQLAHRHLAYGLNRDHLDGFQAALLDALRDDAHVDAETLGAWADILSRNMDEFWKLLQTASARRSSAPGPTLRGALAGA